jgi:hypothetical protein
MLFLLILTIFAAHQKSVSTSGPALISTPTVDGRAMLKERAERFLEIF